MTTKIIPQRMSGTGNIHSISSEHYDREIAFAPGYQYAVILAAYYGGKGYTTHKTPRAAIAASKKVSGYSHIIVDTDGHRYEPDWMGNLIALPEYGCFFEDEEEEEDCE